MNLSQLDPAALLENLHTGVVVHNKDTRIIYANPKALELLRLTSSQALGKDALDPEWRFVDTHSQLISVDSFPVNRVIKTKEPITNLEVGILDSSSEKVTWVLCNAYPEFDEQQNINQIVVSFVDITRQKKIIPFEDIVELANDVIVVTEASSILDDGPKIVYVNKAFTELTGYTKEEVLGKTPRILQGPDTSVETTDKIRLALSQQLPVKAKILNYSKSGDEYWLDMNIVPMKSEFDDVCYFAAVERDITEQMTRENKLKELSIRDPLTSLLNRRGYFEAAQALLSYSKRNEKPVTLAMIDIDHFKKINDNYGHHIGDKVLKIFAEIMSESFRDSDIVGRLGGEEFSILLADSNLFNAKGKLEEFRSTIEQNVIITDTDDSINFTISVGLADCKKGREYDLDVMLKQADRCLYQAKESGRNKVFVQ
ncbi:diguanylate cyclase [Colwellia sp. BRX10-3]|uniref:sensor domain-containing diguanylate cyclase n=1 Tax=Colwellia sp. BRX10-3 TaxID=2759844 RepID=UPI0015F67856|nr:sensor domain-containing diguanylate cyclase [Colwellia sp. BRX10-3]MBA6389545.1 diguanylate cyclase [Colwellia sp. BRX10-3]